MYIESGPEFYRNANSRGVSTICEKESRTRWTERTMNETRERERERERNELSEEEDGKREKSESRDI